MLGFFVIIRCDNSLEERDFLASKKVKSDNVDISELIEKCLSSTKTLDSMIEDLACDSRAKRQIAAEAIAGVSKRDVSKLSDRTYEIVDALNRPEQTTRWRCLEALAKLVDVDAKACEKAIDAADAALFDERIGSLRLASFNFLAKLGSTSVARSKKVWPLMDEALQCYHGDIEFDDMLKSTYEFANGKLDKSVKAGLVERFSFDAETARGTLKERSQNIINAAKGK